MTGRRAAGIRTSATEPTLSESRPVKRSRVTRACDQCRASREKCDGSQPECKTCTSQERSCSYNEAPKKRGIQPNYIRTLELTLAWIFRSFPQAESELSTSLPNADGLPQQLLNGKDAVASESLHQYWRNSIINTQIDQMLSGAQVELVSKAATPGEHDGLDQTAARTQSPDLSLSGDNGGLDLATSGIQYRSPSNLLSTDGNKTAEVTVTGPNNFHEPVIQLPANALALIEFYFAFTQPWLPMIQKHSMLKLMYSYESTELQQSQALPAEHAELWSILAVASSQMSWEMDPNETARIRSIAESFLPKSHNYEVPHIKTMILLSVIDMQSEQILAAWLRLGTVIRVLTLLRLVQNLGATDKWCRHVHLAAFVVENALARRLSALPHLSVSYITAIGFLPEDGMDEWNPWIDPLDTTTQGVPRSPSKAFSTLNELVRRALATTAANSEAQGFEMHNPDYDNIVFELLRNACSQYGRVQPSKLVDAGKKDLHALPAIIQSKSLHSPPMASISRRPLSGLNVGHSDAAVTEPSQRYQTYSFSAPETNQGQQSSQGFSDTVQRLLLDSMSPSQNVEPHQGRDGSAIDIFEQLAVLEQSEPVQGSKFMQNLGFAPDIDLAEFFGADYQPSDPLLTYMLPTPHKPGVS